MGQQLLNAASDLMIQQNTADVSLHAIARHAGVTGPLVTYHFGSKEGLLIALVRRDAEYSVRQLQALVKMNDRADNKLRRHIHGLITTYARYPYLNDLLSLLLRGASSAATRDEIYRDFVQPARDAQRAILMQGEADGLLKPADPDFVYATIVGACTFFFVNEASVARLARANRREVEIRAFAETLSNMILTGLFADGSRDAALASSATFP